MSRPARAARPVGPGWWLLRLFVAGAYAFMLAPILVVLIEAFSASDLMAFPPTSLSLRWFRALLAHRGFMESFRLSLVLAFWTAVLSTALGTLAAYGLVRFRPSHHLAVEALLLAPLYTPRVVLGLSLLLTLATVSLVGTLKGLLLGHVLITLPYVLRTVAVSLLGVDPAVEEAAQSLGATRPQTFWKITLPLVRSGVLAGLVFAFIISFSDVYLALFLTGPRATTLPIRLFTAMQWEHSPLIAAVSAAQIALIVVFFVVAGRAIGLSKIARLG